MIRPRPVRSPFSPSVLLLAGLLSTSGSLGCTDSTPSTAALPTGLGVTCSSTSSAGDAAAARTQLAAASPGSCIVLTGAAYAGPFTVPAGVGLVAQNGARATITGGTAQQPAISAGEGAQLVGLDVVDALGVGVALRAAKALVVNVSVTGAKSAAFAVLCKEASTPGCASSAIRMNDVALGKSSLGLWVSGAHVVMTGGSSSGHAGTSLAAASGIIALDGAKLELDHVTVEKNEGAGILVDGETTTASVKNSTVSENRERGLWAQRVAGTLEAPAIRIENTKLEKNRIVGVGAVESRGIIIVGGRIGDTVAAPLVTNLQITEQIGDGVGLFKGSSDFRLESALVESNARAAGVIDGTDRGIIIVGGTVGAGTSGLKFVVQNSKATDIQIPASDRSTPAQILGVADSTLVLPPVL